MDIGESMLGGLGLSTTAEVVYQAMLFNPELGVTGLAGLTGLTHTEIRAHLDELAAFDLLRPGWDRADGPRAVGPEVGLAGLLARREAELDAERSRIDEARAKLAAFIKHCNDHRTGAGQVERLVGSSGVRERLTEMADTVRFELLVFNPTPELTDEALAASRPLDERMLRRGVTARSIYLDSAVNHGRLMAYADWFRDLGGELRAVPVLPMRLIIADRERVLLPTTLEDATFGAEVHNSPGVVAALVSLFDAFWIRARPLGERPPARRGADLTEQDRELLMLLAEGATDEVAARRLGVSPRTVRRMAAHVSLHLRARSRFQAGVRAAHQGLV